MSSENDLKQLGEDYYNSLKELTFNSRPIITTLTVLAQENIPAAKYITNAITKRINKAVPGQKLFALYLLDSICKNVGSPYTVLFSSSLSKAFIDTYTLVDDAHRKKMIDLYKTWRVAKTTSGLPLFQAEPITNIDKFLQKVAKGNQPPAHLSPRRQLSPQLANTQLQLGQHNNLTSASLIADIDSLQLIINKKLTSLPNDNNSRQKLTILSQLRNILVAQTLGASELGSIHNQLQGIINTEITSKNANAPTTTSLPHSTPTNNNLSPANISGILSMINSNNNQQNNRQFNSPPSQNQDLHPPQFNPAQNLQNILSNINYNAPKPVNNNNPSSSIGHVNYNSLSGVYSDAKPQGKNMDLNTLFKTLQTTGLIKPNANINGLSEAPAANKPAVKKPLVNLPSTSLLQDILSKTKAQNNSSANETGIEGLDLSDFELSNSSISANGAKARSLRLQFNKLHPIKCFNCGKRFDKKLDSQAHLDWHFRIKKRLKDPSNINTRSFYLDSPDFVNFRENEILGTVSEEPDNNNSGTKKPQDTGPHIVVVPDDCVDMTTTCNICKDTLKGVWDDAKGEWIWKNAVHVNNQVYHWTCYDETQRNKLNRETGKRKLQDDGGDQSVKKQNVNGLNLNFDILKNLNIVPQKNNLTNA